MTPHSSRKRPLQARAQVTLDALVTAAERVLQNEGADRLTTNRIAEIAGTSVGSVYQYFPNKQAIVMALAERYLKQFVEAFEALLVASRERPLDEIIEIILRGMNHLRRSQGATVHRALQELLTADALDQSHTSALARYAQSLDRLLIERADTAPHRTRFTAFVVVNAASGFMRAWALDEHSLEDDELVIAEGVRMLGGFLAPTQKVAASAERSERA